VLRTLWEPFCNRGPQADTSREIGDRGLTIRPVPEEGLFLKATGRGCYTGRTFAELPRSKRVVRVPVAGRPVR